jgi:hypothetical protein
MVNFLVFKPAAFIIFSLCVFFRSGPIGPILIDLDPKKMLFLTKLIFGFPTIILGLKISKVGCVRIGADLLTFWVLCDLTNS